MSDTQFNELKDWLSDHIKLPTTIPQMRNGVKLSDGHIESPIKKAKQEAYKETLDKVNEIVCDKTT